mgnify:CR=1 FL=1
MNARHLSILLSLSLIALLAEHENLAVRSAPYSLLFSKKAPNAEELLAAFNEGLAELKASGRYQEILDDAASGKYSTP